MRLESSRDMGEPREITCRRGTMELGDGGGAEGSGGMRHVHTHTHKA